MEKDTLVAEEKKLLDPKKRDQYKKLMLNPLTFRAGLVTKLPMALLAGLRVRDLDDHHSKVTVPFKHLNVNPFGTTYWAVLGMAAEMAPGTLVMMYVYKLNPSVSTFVIGCEGKFIKRAVGLTTFVCNDGQMVADAATRAIETGEAQEITTTSVGYNDAGEVVSEFTFTWGLKVRKK